MQIRLESTGDEALLRFRQFLGGRKKAKMDILNVKLVNRLDAFFPFSSELWKNRNHFSLHVATPRRMAPPLDSFLAHRALEFVSFC